jgi:hypothetical protein
VKAEYQYSATIQLQEHDVADKSRVSFLAKPLWRRNTHGSSRRARVKCAVAISQTSSLYIPSYRASAILDGGIEPVSKVAEELAAMEQLADLAERHSIW